MFSELYLHIFTTYYNLTGLLAGVETRFHEFIIRRLMEGSGRFTRKTTIRIWLNKSALIIKRDALQGVNSPLWMLIHLKK